MKISAKRGRNVQLLLMRGKACSVKQMSPAASAILPARLTHPVGGEDGRQYPQQYAGVDQDERRPGFLLVAAPRVGWQSGQDPESHPAPAEPSSPREETRCGPGANTRRAEKWNTFVHQNQCPEGKAKKQIEEALPMHRTLRRGILALLYPLPGIDNEKQPGKPLKNSGKNQHPAPKGAGPSPAPAHPPRAHQPDIQQAKADQPRLSLPRGFTWNISGTSSHHTKDQHRNPAHHEQV